MCDEDGETWAASYCLYMNTNPVDVSMEEGEFCRVYDTHHGIIAECV